MATELRKFANRTPNVRILTLCGGTPIFRQINSLAHGAHCIVGTPGRVNDLLRRGNLNFEKLNSFVLDEADRMLDMGFADDLEEIVKSLPRNHQSLLFSATYEENIKSLSNKILNNPVYVEIDAKDNTDSINQLFFEVPSENRLPSLCSALNYYNAESSIVFVKRRYDAMRFRRN